MPEDTVYCTECGKEVPASLDVCEECGARHFRGRAPRKGIKRQAETDVVTTLADRLRTVPRAATRKLSGRARRKQSRRNEPRRAPRRAPRPQPAAEDDRTVAAEDEALPPGVKRIARRKIYRYAQAKRKTFLYGAEVRAVVFVVLLGIILIVMCHMQRAQAAPGSAPAPTLATTPPARRASASPPPPAKDAHARPPRRDGAEQGGSTHDQVHQLLVVPARHERGAEDARREAGRLSGH